MANKKINQLVAKTTILSTDLFPLGNPTTGQLFKKTIGELQAAIGGAVISVNGLVGTVVLDTDDIAELASPTNRYFTEARARAAISLTTTGTSGASTYSNSTGVLNVPNYTLAGLGGITASFLSAGAGISYNSGTGVISYTGNIYTDASIRALFSAGTGISYNSSTGAISYSGTVYTDASIRALISLTTTGSSGASTYNNTTGVLNVPTYTLAGLGGISLTSLSGTAPISYNSSTGVISISQANTTTNGFLSSTDWNTFNGKQSALTLGNVTESVSNVLMFPDGGTNKTIGNLSIQVVQAGSTTNGYLSTTDWNTFNNKQNAITLTTTGTSGAATFSSNTLNIPQYQAVLTNPVTGTGTAGYHAKWTSGTAIGNGIIYDDGNQIGINVTPPTWYSNFKGLNLPNGSFIGYSTNASIFLNQNLYFNAAGSWTFVNTGTGGQYSIDGTANHTFSTVASGSAGAAATLVERMRITSAGNVGIGTSSPANTNGYTSLTINGTTGSIIELFSNGTRSMQIVSDSSSSYLYGALNTPMMFYTNATERMRITSAGDISINNAITTNGKLNIKQTSAASYAGINIYSSNGNGTFLGLGNTGSVCTVQANYETGGYIPLSFLAGGSEVFRITTSTNMLIGTTSDNGEKLYVSGSIRATGSITANSDARLKKNIERIENALEKVGQISGYTYNTIYDEDRHAGVIAQEIDKVLPEIVNKGNDGLMGVEYGNISALLIEAIKEQKVLIESLQAKVEALSK